jgi:hypothetical protein
MNEVTKDEVQVVVSPIKATTDSPSAPRSANLPVGVLVLSQCQKKTVWVLSMLLILKNENRTGFVPMFEFSNFSKE